MAKATLLNHLMHSYHGGNRAPRGSAWQRIRRMELWRRRMRPRSPEGKLRLGYVPDLPPGVAGDRVMALWTMEEYRLLVGMITAGKTVDEMSAAFQRSRGAIRQRFNHMGLTWNYRPGRTRRWKEYTTQRYMKLALGAGRVDLFALYAAAGWRKEGPTYVLPDALCGNDIR